MRLQDLELSPTHEAGLIRLLEKMGVSAGASRDESDMCRRTFGITVRAGGVNDEERTVDVVASTAALDSYDEVVDQEWRLERYLQNPVVLYAHNAVGLCGPAEDTLPIGYASEVGVVDGSLVARLHFVDEKANPMAEKVWQGFRQRSIRAVSVGFRPHATIEEERDGKKILHLRDNELFEISACPIPANPEAVARSAQRNRAQAIRLAQRTSDAAKEQTMSKAKTEATPATEPTVHELVLAPDAEHKAALDAALERARAAETSLSDALIKLAATETRAKAAEERLNVLEVEKQVGVKLLPYEVDEFVELRAANPDLYERMLEKRAELPHGKSIVPPDPTQREVTAPAGSQELVRLAKDEAKAPATDLASIALGG